jgi:hypothetical protein
MAKLSLGGKERVRTQFHQHNQVRAQRTVQLTRQAIAQLKLAGAKITLAAVAEATRAFDELGKGLAPNTILRNAEACELFHQSSESYQHRRQQQSKATRRRSRMRLRSNASAAYRGLRTADLIQIIEQLKQTMAELQAQLSVLQTERDAARQFADDLQQQNIRQLAALTSVKKTTPN